MISLDDFGTGYSPLTYLKVFPIDGPKIDHSFVRDVLTEGSGAALVRAIIAMAGALGLMVIAEGVESQEELDFMRINGCDEIQGCDNPAHASRACCGINPAAQRSWD